MAKGDFDYARAWRELAEPAFKCLPADVRGLYDLVCGQCADLHQDANCDMCWPVDVDEARELRQRFENLESAYLAAAAHIVNAYGHWYPGHNPDATGGHWKFSRYCDQVLRVRCSLPVRAPRGDGVHFEIHEGFLRLCCSHPRGWTWEEVGVATPAFLDRCRPLLPKRAWKRADKLLAAYEESLRAIKALDGRWDSYGSTWLVRFAPEAMGMFIERSAEEEAIDTVLGDSGLRRVDIRAVNFQPHPFMITNKHLERSTTMMLDPSVAPCGVKGCRLSYDEHTHERVLCVVGGQPKDEHDVELNDAQKAALKALAPVLEAHKLAGVAFLRPEDV